jgi:hypothetical protein
MELAECGEGGTNNPQSVMVKGVRANLMLPRAYLMELPRDMKGRRLSARPGIGTRTHPSGDIEHPSLADIIIEGRSRCLRLCSRTTKQTS